MQWSRSGLMSGLGADRSESDRSERGSPRLLVDLGLLQLAQPRPLPSACTRPDQPISQHNKRNENMRIGQSTLKRA